MLVATLLTVLVLQCQVSGSTQFNMAYLDILKSITKRFALLAIENQPKMIIAGGSAIPRVIDFAKFRTADEVGAICTVDMAHIAGLIATGAHPSPLPHAHAVTTTTHKNTSWPTRRYDSD